MTPDQRFTAEQQGENRSDTLWSLSEIDNPKGSGQGLEEKMAFGEEDGRTVESAWGTFDPENKSICIPEHSSRIVGFRLVAISDSGFLQARIPSIPDGRVCSVANQISPPEPSFQIWLSVSRLSLGNSEMATPRGTRRSYKQKSVLLGFTITSSSNRHWVLLQHQTKLYLNYPRRPWRKQHAS